MYLDGGDLAPPHLAAAAAPAHSSVRRNSAPHFTGASVITHVCEALPHSALRRASVLRVTAPVVPLIPGAHLLEDSHLAPISELASPALGSAPTNSTATPPAALVAGLRTGSMPALGGSANGAAVGPGDSPNTPTRHRLVDLRPAPLQLPPSNTTSLRDSDSLRNPSSLPDAPLHPHPYPRTPPAQRPPGQATTQPPAPQQPHEHTQQDTAAGSSTSLQQIQMPGGARSGSGLISHASEAPTLANHLSNRTSFKLTAPSGGRSPSPGSSYAGGGGGIGARREGLSTDPTSAASQALTADDQGSARLPPAAHVPGAVPTLGLGGGRSPVRRGSARDEGAAELPVESPGAMRTSRADVPAHAALAFLTAVNASMPAGAAGASGALPLPHALPSAEQPESPDLSMLVNALGETADAERLEAAVAHGGGGAAASSSAATAGTSGASHTGGQTQQAADKPLGKASGAAAAGAPPRTASEAGLVLAREGSQHSSEALQSPRMLPGVPTPFGTGPSFRYGFADTALDAVRDAASAPEVTGVTPSGVTLAAPSAGGAAGAVAPWAANPGVKGPAGGRGANEDEQQQ